jgi:hypothetical protein
MVAQDAPLLFRETVLREGRSKKAKGRSKEDSASSLLPFTFLLSYSA